MSVVLETQKKQIAEIVCEVLEIDIAEISGESLFQEDHGADSLRAIEILATLEEQLGVEIDQAELSRMVNLEGVYAVVSEAAVRR